MQGQLLHDVKVVAQDGRVNPENLPKSRPMPKAPSELVSFSVMPTEGGASGLVTAVAAR